MSHHVSVQLFVLYHWLYILFIFITVQFEICRYTAVFTWTSLQLNIEMMCHGMWNSVLSLWCYLTNASIDFKFLCFIAVKLDFLYWNCSFSPAWYVADNSFSVGLNYLVFRFFVSLFRGSFSSDLSFFFIVAFLKWKRYQTHLDGLVQDCSNSIYNALELLQSCTKPSIWFI